MRETVVALLRCHALAQIGRRVDVAEIVHIAGLSESTLRRIVEAATGESLGQFITHVRLDQVHAWLSANREVRTQSELAAALGFASTSAFSRAYVRRFGESMTATRRRALGLVPVCVSVPVGHRER